MKSGLYWYRGPLFRDGERADPSPRDAEWRAVQIFDSYGGGQHLCYMGGDWDGNESDIAAMKKAGEFRSIPKPMKPRS
jgi:hypothetical protein